jgi:hypothetical protein
MWAAFMALTNEESIKAGGFNIGFVNPLLYQIASSSTYANDFHDITTGNNAFNGATAYPATAAYDMATGLGSFNAANLAADLVNLTVNAPGGKRLAPAAPIWYFAEGYIGNGFEELFTIQNPDPVNISTFTVTYVFPSAPAIVKSHTVNPSSRMTVSANSDLGVGITAPHVTISAIVQVAQGSPNIVVERPMYFKYVNGSTTIQSGTDVVGATKPAASYYFAEGDTRQTGGHHYWTYITMLNQSATTSANVTVTYFTGACGGTGPACLTEKFALKPLQRATARPDDSGINLHQQVAISVTSDQPIVAERPMYVQDTITNAGGTFSGAASEIGATQLAKDWLFAEGYTGGSGGSFQQYFVLANFGGTAANVTVKMEYNGGLTKTVPVTVAPYSQNYVDVNKINVGAPSAAAAAEITSDQPIVADRLLAFHQGASRNIQGITDALGEAGPASHSVYSFAEGYTGGSGGNFQQLLTMQNPTNFSETIAITIFTPGTVFQQQAVLVAHSRTTFSVNNILNLIQKGSNSITVQALPTQSNPTPLIVVERPMYYTMTLAGVSGIQQGGTDVFGFTG